jgi:hypothetical protein
MFESLPNNGFIGALGHQKNSLLKNVLGSTLWAFASNVNVSLRMLTKFQLF